MTGILLTILTATDAATAYGQPPEDEENPPEVDLGRWARDLKVGPKMNAVGRNLRGSVFVSQDLRNALFSDGDLLGAYFVNCDLSKAFFKGAVLSGAELNACDLADADFDDAIINAPRRGLAGLTVRSSAQLSEKQLKSTRSYRTRNLTGCTICASRWNSNGQEQSVVKYDFRGAKLFDARLINGDFSGCDFSDADVDGVNLCGARITFGQLASTASYRQRRLHKLAVCNFAGTEIPRGLSVITGKVDFRGIDLTGLVISGPPLRDADFTDATITDGFFVGGITKEQLCSTRNYRQGNLSRMCFKSIDFSACDLSRQDLTACRFEDCIFAGTNFEDAVITNIDFSLTRDVRGHPTLEQVKLTWNYKHGRMAGVRLPKVLADALEEKG